MPGIDVELFGTDGDSRKVPQTMHSKLLMPTGSVIYTEPYRDLVPERAALTNATEGGAMNINASFGGTPDLVHDGIDTVAWTGSNIIGNDVTFNSTDRFNSGSASVEVDNPDENDIWEFDKGSDITISNYTAVTMAINIDKEWSANDSMSLYAYDTGTASTIGNEVQLEDYIDETEFDMWQNASIPLADMGLGATNFDSFRMVNTNRDGKKSPTFYIDDFQVEETGDPVKYRTNTPSNKNYYINTINFTFIDALNTTLASNSMPNLSYDKFLGLNSLSNGLLFQRFVDDVATFSTPITQLSDFTRLGFRVEPAFSDGTNTAITVIINFPTPLVLYGGDNNYLSVTVSDDLSGLLGLTATCTGTLEHRDNKRH